MSDKLYYRLTRRGIETHSEIICAVHYAHASQEGRDMAPLSDREKGAGLRQTVNEYNGDRPCATCEEQRMHAKGAA